MSLYAAVKRSWHAVVPSGVRHLLWRITPPGLKRVRGRVVRSLEAGASHDEIYDAAYYEGLVDPVMRESAGVIASSVLADVHPASAVDVGCGTGLLLLTLRERGVQVVGLERSEAGVAMCRQRGIDVRRFDIESDAPPGLRADLVISTEVAEHLPESCADRFVDLLTGMGDTVLLTAAEPSGGYGADHVNEQPMSYWIEKFAARGFSLDTALSERWRAAWKAAGCASCFHATAMLFRRGR